MFIFLYFIFILCYLFDCFFFFFLGWGGGGGVDIFQTGTGFIKIENINDKCYNMGSDSITVCHASSKCNPATNDWIPLPEAANIVNSTFASFT